MGEKVSRSPLTKKFPETLATPISETLQNACNVVDIIAKIPADFCNFTPPIFAITPPSPADFCKFMTNFLAHRPLPLPASHHRFL
jgi:hypothetical protein